MVVLHVFRDSDCDAGVRWVKNDNIYNLAASHKLYLCTMQSKPTANKCC